MIRVSVRYINSKEFESLSIKGHAYSGEPGHDLVCAAVSGIVLGGINALKEDMSLELDEKKGFLELTKTKELSKHDEIVIETIVAQLQSIKRDNPKYIEISILNR